MTDTENCVLCEIDLLRSKVYTAAGTQGICGRTNASPGTVIKPQRIISTCFTGYFLFMDKYPTQIYPAIR